MKFGMGKPRDECAHTQNMEKNVENEELTRQMAWFCKHFSLKNGYYSASAAEQCVFEAQK